MHSVVIKFNQQREKPVSDNKSTAISNDLSSTAESIFFNNLFFIVAGWPFIFGFENQRLSLISISDDSAGFWFLGMSALTVKVLSLNSPFSCSRVYWLCALILLYFSK
jgi:hypothetical protein